MKTINMDKKEKIFDRINNVYDVGKTLGILMGMVENINTFIYEHKNEHRTSRIVTGIQTLIIIILFCFLKWGI